MLFMFTISINDNKTGNEVFVTYPVDLLRGHVVKGKALYDSALSGKPVGDYRLLHDGNIVPKELWPVLVPRIRNWEMKIYDKMQWTSVVALHGKRFQASLTLRRVLAPRPAQS